MKLFCAIVGVAGSAFEVDIDDGASVSALKKAIKDVKPRTITTDEPDQLQLFLAKTDDGAWLESDSEDVKKLKKGEKTVAVEALTSEEKELQGESGLQKVLTGMPKPSTDQIHVLVVVPEQDNLRSPAMVLLEVMLPHILTHAPTTRTERNRGFKEQLCNFYGCYRRKKSWQRIFVIGDDANIGYRRCEECFIRDDTDAFRLKLFDPDIRDTRLIDLTDRNGNQVLSAEQIGVLFNSVSLAKKRCHFDVQTTFGDVDGSTLTFTGLERPFYRCLNLQARVARMIALKKHWIDASYDFPDFWSEVSLDDKMEMFHRSIFNADATV
ncbi:hypothetical protein PC114_g27014 [Phytophthora cactorum]|nr:hypothetical protein PC114_g27014 [Phytophthora cactorum]